MYHEVDCYSNLFTHHEYRFGSLPGALVALLNHVAPGSHTKISKFIDAKGNTIPWATVRTALSTPKVMRSLDAKIKTKITPEGMIFYKWKRSVTGEM